MWSHTEPNLTAALSNALFNDAVPNELRQPLPASYQATRNMRPERPYLKYVANYKP